MEKPKWWLQLEWFRDIGFSSLSHMEAQSVGKGRAIAWMASVHRPSLFPFSGLCISVAVLTEELGPCPDSLTHGGQMTNFGQSNVVEKIAHQLCIWTMGRLPLLRLTLGAEAWACQLARWERHVGPESDFIAVHPHWGYPRLVSTPLSTKHATEPSQAQEDPPEKRHPHLWCTNSWAKHMHILSTHYALRLFVMKNYGSLAN